MRRAWKIAAALAVLGAVALAAYFVFTLPDRTTVRSTTPGEGQAASITGPVGFQLKVTSTENTGGRLVLQLRFTNASQQQQRADPTDFRLSASGGWSARPAFDDGCPNWGRVDLYPPGGGDQPLRDAGGTRAGSTWSGVLCFPAPPAGRQLTLVWEPDVAFGPLGEPVLIRLG